MATNTSQNFIQIVVPYKSNGTGPSQVIDNIVETAAGEDSLQEYNTSIIAEDQYLLSKKDGTSVAITDYMRQKKYADAVIGAVGNEKAIIWISNYVLGPSIEASSNMTISNCIDNFSNSLNTMTDRITQTLSTSILVNGALARHGKVIPEVSSLAIGVASAAISAVLDFKARTAQKNTELQQQAIEAIKRANRAGVISSKRGRAPSSEYKM